MVKQTRPMPKPRRRILLFFAVIAGAALLFIDPASSHVTLATKEAPVGAEYKAVFRVPHGCKGSATITLSVEMPDGMIAVKPQPKPGWQIEIVKGTYDKPYHLYRSEVTAGVKSVTWFGGKLPDDYYDEFALIGHLDKGLQPGSRLYFPIVQTCEQGVDRWVEIPDDGHSSERRRFPAPFVHLLPAAAGGD
jgi:periplasmic copper chaperone A